MNLRAKTASVLGAAAVAAASLVVVPAGTAHAAYPTCNSNKNLDTSYGNVRQPYYTGTGSRNCVLGVGDDSIAVTRLQIVLRDCYGRNITADSQYGKNTRDAVAYVQNYEGVPADGTYGPLTRKAMKWKTSYGSCVRLGI
ncbi:peptidoglycan-binding domain-containing protein [Streptomyces sp. JJ38]|uniref:peptidoglycan-binding domain-containing protein n=1 Tax=Streptomyces sp. JJ38 TaxID=2738128 RepID=UPI001C57D32A|nr:peptidoglycan-binding domain-containing protein [Streptomyces sp. JJ38]MBW1596943.1 peptidoglycan-binding protein [Streptomyces sp. JJ38]